jgi:HEPN domain-containing protein
MSFHQACIILYKSLNMDGYLRVSTFNAALSLELILKSVLAKKNVSIPQSHHLRELAELAEINLNLDQKDTLDRFKEMFVWVGRYPTPRKEEDWDEYHDDVLQKRRIRESWGDMYTQHNIVRANPKTFPSLENYTAIWNICVAEYNA